MAIQMAMEVATVLPPTAMEAGHSMEVTEAVEAIVCLTWVLA